METPAEENAKRLPHVWKTPTDDCEMRTACEVGKAILGLEIPMGKRKRTMRIQGGFHMYGTPPQKIATWCETRSTCQARKSLLGVGKFR